MLLQLNIEYDDDDVDNADENEDDKDDDDDDIYVDNYISTFRFMEPLQT